MALSLGGAVNWFLQSSSDENGGFRVSNSLEVNPIGDASTTNTESNKIRDRRIAKPRLQLKAYTATIL